MSFSMDMTDAVNVSNVSKRYGTVHALNDVNLKIARGEFFGLLGPNGAGKSTLISIIAGLTLTDSGNVSVMGYDVVGEYREARRRLGLVPQELVFDAFFTVREVLRIQAGYFGLGRENDDWIDELLAELMLTDKADSNMRALSGGMKRRVLIAQALVHKPDVVVLDEPTAGVDVEVRRLMWRFIRRLHGDGHTIILTTHYLEEAEALCDRIAILNHGTVIALDTKQGLLDSDIGKMVTVRIVSDDPVTHVPDSIADKVRNINGNTMTLEICRDKDSISDVLGTLTRSGIRINDLHTERADLEDVFLQLAYRNAR